MTETGERDAAFLRARSPEAKAAREQAILEAARALGRERGTRAVTLTDIADAVGMHKSAMLRYFETREEIFLRLTAEGLERAREGELRYQECLALLYLSGAEAARGEPDLARSAAELATAQPNDRRVAGRCPSGRIRRPGLPAARRSTSHVLIPRSSTRQISK